MSYPEAIVFGILQGLTEFLPVSSSGHLALLHHYFGYQEADLFFDIFLHIATFFTIVVYFWRDIISVLKENRRLLLYVAAASIPTAVAGVLFSGFFESMFAMPKIVALMLCVTGALLLLADRAARKSPAVPAKSELTWFNSLVIGLVQAASIMPGISRSGSTISAAMILGIKRKDAVRFSFLLAIPAMLGAFIFKLCKSYGQLHITAQMAAGAVAAFLVGLGAVHMLLKVVYNNRLKYFGFYCLLIGVMVLAL